ncbi:MAG: hypothetical protein F6K23_06470 [Okeania sp. SIO2C9]|uniref:hypothetical protein n=1 Tax=Okeania sp. SIO2C9 TaxID=2607791 RepID=UPI0013C27B24|nr:hypothetical protein [Okeania sp. SIO2C9]NEQ72747.1 hypothetical protein [Okeania sp. SIO2C9]
MGRWGDGEMGRWGDGEMGGWGVREKLKKIYLHHYHAGLPLFVFRQAAHTNCKSYQIR